MHIRLFHEVAGRRMCRQSPCLLNSILPSRWRFYDSKGRGTPCFFAFDHLYSDGKDWRRDGLADRKAAVRRLLQQLAIEAASPKLAKLIEDRFGQISEHVWRGW